MLVMQTELVNIKSASNADPVDNISTDLYPNLQVDIRSKIQFIHTFVH